MKAKVAVFPTHERAIEAVKLLDKNGFNMKHVSLVGQASMQEDHITVESNAGKMNTPVLVGAGAGIIAGILTGIGVFTIPGFGFLYGAGAVVGAIGGFDLGIIGGGLLSIGATIGLKDEQVVQLEKHLKEGKFVLIVKGPVDEVEKAEHILHTEGLHLEQEGYIPD
jgi:hypothetical protein